MLIPPSALAVLLGSLAGISIAQLLIAGIVPGLLMGAAFIGYILLRCRLNPRLAPSYDVAAMSGAERWRPFVVYVLPLLVIFVVVVGSILGGFATPTESAALGAVAALLACAAYGRLTVTALVTSLFETAKVSVMILFIIASSLAFAQVLAFSGATSGLLGTVDGLGLSPAMLLLAMLLVLLFLGCFIDQVSMALITLPFFIPLAQSARLDLIWFAVLVLIVMEISFTTPPFRPAVVCDEGGGPAPDHHGADLRRRRAGHHHQGAGVGPDPVGAGANSTVKTGRASYNFEIETDASHGGVAAGRDGRSTGIGPGTFARCAYHLGLDGARSYELSHRRSNTMSASPFGRPLAYAFTPSVSLPGTRHVFNGEQVLGGEPGAQGTQMDALGHFAFYDQVWSGEAEAPLDSAQYYGGFTQGQVKPSPDSPLLKLGIEQVPPIVTSAVLLDAKTHLGGGDALEPRQLITAADIEAMLDAQGLSWRGILPGDVVYVYTGWSENWADPDEAQRDYGQGPCLGRDAADYLAERGVVLVALDNPFTDPVAAGQLQGQAAPPQGLEDGLPFVIHHVNLAVAGIHQIQNAKLDALAADRVWTSCTLVLPLRSKGHAGSPVRPVAIGRPSG